MTVLKKEKTAIFTGKQLCWSPLLIDLPASKLVDIRCHSLYHSLSFLITRSHSLSFVAICCHSLYHSLSLVVPVVVICCHSLSFVATRCTTRCCSLSLVVTRCTTSVSFYKRSVLVKPEK